MRYNGIGVGHVGVDDEARGQGVIRPLIAEHHQENATQNVGSRCCLFCAMLPSVTAIIGA